MHKEREGYCKAMIPTKHLVLGIGQAARVRAAGSGYVVNLFWLSCSHLFRHAAFVSCVFVLSCVQCIAPLQGEGSTLWTGPTMCSQLWLLSEKINHVEEIER
jgi:hypothetical protein